MKRVFCLILTILMLVPLSGCSSGTKLTLDNIDTYFKYDSSDGYFINEEFTPLSPFSASLSWSHSLGSSFYVTGVSRNFNYRDVSITIKYTLEYTDRPNYPSHDGDEHKVDTGTITITLDISGNGQEYCRSSNTELMFKEFHSCTWEIVSISGYVEPA